LLSESDNARRFKVEDSTASRRAVDPATRSNLLVAAVLVLLLTALALCLWAATNDAAGPPAHSDPRIQREGHRPSGHDDGNIFRFPSPRI
jgi:hypothetical protein